MTPEDKKFERIAQRHIADLKKSSKAIVEDAAVLAAHKVMAEFAQGAHTEAKVEYHTTMIQCPHCDGSVGVPVQPYPDNFIDALKYDVAKRDSEAQQQDYWQEEARRYAQNAEFWRGKYEEATAQQQEPVAWTPIEQPYPQGSELDILMGDGSILCAVLPQADGDLWWGGAGTGEKFIDPKYASVTHWRIHAAHGIKGDT